MKIRASLLTPVLSILTVAALIGTGILLGQGHGVQADATLIGSTPEFPAPVSAEATLVAESGPVGDAGAITQRPAEETCPAIGPAPADPGVVTDDQASSSPPAPTTRPTTGKTDHSTGSGVEYGESDAHTAPAQHDEGVESEDITAGSDESYDVESHDAESRDVESHDVESHDVESDSYEIEHD